jgi:integrase
MSRRVRDKDLSTRTARAKLKARGKPYYRAIDPGLHLGYRKGQTGGRWVARIYGGDGGYEVKTIGGIADDKQDADGRAVLDYGQALEAARALYVEAKGKLPIGEHSPLTVRQAFKEYVSYLRLEVSEHDAYCAEGALLGAIGKRGKPRRCKVSPALLDTLVVDLKKSQLEAWKRSQVKRTDPEEKRRDMDTANRVLTMIKAALNRAFDDDDNKILSNAAWARVKSFEDVGRGRKLHLSIDQTIRLLNTIGANTGLYKLTAGAFVTGARPGELVGARVGDFDKDARTLTINAGKTGERTAWLNSEGADLLTQITAGRKPSEPLFLKDDGTPWKQDWNRPLKKAAERAKLPIGRGGVCLYSARHAHISQALVVDAGDRMPVQMLSENVGTSIKMLEENYGKFFDQARRELVDRGTPKLGLKIGNVVQAKVARGRR